MQIWLGQDLIPESQASAADAHAKRQGVLTWALGIRDAPGRRVPPAPNDVKASRRLAKWTSVILLLWYDQETCQPWEDGCPTGDGKCLTAADDCSVFHGTIGDLVCVLRGFEGGNPPWPPPSAEVDGSCLTRRESASVPIGDCCDGHNWFYDLYELTEAGECKLEVRRSSSEGDILHVHFDIHLVVTQP